MNHKLLFITYHKINLHPQHWTLLRFAAFKTYQGAKVPLSHCWNFGGPQLVIVA